jgi:CMP-N,N'-diacetyllegionaminic acid synthase
MIAGRSVLALIPARGGSKGLPGKNVRPLLGKPLIGWSIEQGRASLYADAVVVSTDDEGVAHTAREFGAEVPFLRPAKLASDTAPTIDMILHALDFLAGQGRSFDLVVLLEPTSPLREARDIDAALETLVARADAQSIVGVARVESAHPAFLVKVENGLIRPYASDAFRVVRRQDLGEVFFFEGSVYAAYAA